MRLSFRVSGFIEHFAVDEGERVEAGTVIAELDRRDFERQVALAASMLDSAGAQAAESRRELERQEHLITASSTSSQRLENTRSAHRIATAELRHAQLKLDAALAELADCSLRAPLNGYIETRLVETHEFAAAQHPVVAFSELDTVVIQASVADNSIASLRPGGRVLIRSRAWPDREFEGRIARLGLAADAATHALPFEIDVENPDLALRPVMVVSVAIPSGESQPRLTVPMNAVVRDGARRTLSFVAAGEGDELYVEARPVTLGELHGDRVAVTSGLSPGERLIVRGQHFLKPGDPVHLTPVVAFGVDAELEQ